MQKTIQKPSYWQDFENLCNWLWEEEFRSRFKQNGRNGQKQKGVDICGIPKDESEYVGIQCKLKIKSEKITKKEIETEILHAEDFKPKLGSLIIATTAFKDAKMEEFVRCVNRERTHIGQFGVQIYFWEDIENLLRANPKTLNRYLENTEVLRRHEVNICFENGEQEATIHPKFFKKIQEKKYVHKSLKLLDDSHLRAIEMFGIDLKKMESLLKGASFNRQSSVNHACCDVKILFENSGSSAIEEWKLYFYLDEKYGCFYEPSNGFMYIPPTKRWKIESEQQVFYHDPDFRSFVQKDICSVSFSIKPKPEIEKFSIEWELISKDYHDQGILKFKVEPEIITQKEFIEVDSPEKEGIEELLKDYCTIGNS